jgi:single-strand DNA-binding protein
VNEPVITIVGSLGQDPEIRYGASGTAMVSFSVATTPRSFNRQTNAWDDGETLWTRCVAFKDLAENIGESLVRGSRVVVTGRLVAKSWDDKTSGEKRTATELIVDDVGASLRFATVKVSRASRESGKAAQPAADDPWATGASSDTSPPF